MFRPEKIKKVTIYALNSDQNAVLSKLHKLGVIQIKSLKTVEEAAELEVAVPAEDIKLVSELLLRVSRIRTALNLTPLKPNFVQNIVGLDLLDKKRIKRKNPKEIIAETDKFLRKYEKSIIELEKKHNDLVEKINEMSKLREIIEMFDKYNLHLALLEDTERLSISAGTIPTNLISRLKEDMEKDAEGYSQLLSKKETKKESIIITVTLKEYAPKVNFLLKKYGVKTFLIPELPPVKNLRIWVNDEIKEAEKSKKEAIAEISNYRKKIFEEVVILREETWILKEKLEAVHKMASSEKFFVLQGWVMRKNTERLEKEISEAMKGKVIVELSDPTEDDEVPVMPTNPGWLKPFEMMTELYALPKYGDLDPTFIVGPLFVIYAGFMLTDFFYGAMVAALGLYILKKFGKYSQGLKGMAINITWIGSVSMIFGVLTGSYFGDAPKYFIGYTTEQLAIWKDPMADPLFFLIVSLAVAVVHLNIGLIMGIIEDIRLKRWKEMIASKVVWLTLQVGIACVYLHVFELFGKILLGLTVLTIIILSGPIGILGITGFMGDIISYSRLFALALSTAGIAMAVNLLAELLSGVPFIGIVLAIIMFIVGHIFSFLMNALGAFVHSLRLQFVEFFGKFYEGGGDRFTPYAEERIYTEIKGE